MGLSDEERYNNIVEIVNELKLIEPFEQSELKSFNKPLKNLWFHLLGKTNNGAHWIIGSASTSNNITGMSIFGSAMIQSKDNIQDEKDFFENTPIKVKLKEYFDYRDNYLPTALKLSLIHI